MKTLIAPPILFLVALAMAKQKRVDAASEATKIKRQNKQTSKYLKNGTQFKVDKNSTLTYTYLNGILFSSTDPKYLKGIAFTVDRLDDEKIIFHHVNDPVDNCRCLFFASCDIFEQRKLSLHDYCQAYLGMTRYEAFEKIGTDSPLSTIGFDVLAKLAEISEMSVPELADELSTILKESK